MNPVIAGQVAAFAEANALTTHTQASQFEIYSIYAIMNGFVGEKLDAYEVHLTGSEFGLDGIAVLVQGEVVKNATEALEKIESIKNPSVEFFFFQSKTATSFDYGDISKFFDAVSGFFDGSLKGESTAIDELIEAKDQIYKSALGKKNPTISCFYVTTGNYEHPTRIQKLISTFSTQLADMNIFDPDEIKISMIGALELQQWYRTATTSVEVTIDFPRNVVMPSNQYVEEGYIGYIDAENLLALYTTKDSDGAVVGINRSVFFDNIRDYDPRSKINSAIKESVAAGGAEEFVFRNNGITVVARHIDRTGDRFKLDDFQIVNGCQTSNIIFDLVFGGKPKDKQDAEARAKLKSSIRVPFRLIGSKDGDFVSSIIVGTNSQNPVRDEQFWALRTFMKNLEEYCRGIEKDEALYLERRENQYRGQAIERTRILQPSALMKAVAAGILFQPHRAARDYRGLLAEYDEAIFLDSHDVRIYHAIGFLYYRLEFLWRNQRISHISKTFRFYLIAGIGLAMTEGKNIFGMKAANIKKLASNLVDLCKDEDDLVFTLNEVFEIIEDRLGALGISTQERIRDAIRTESFEQKFRETILAHEFDRLNAYLEG